MAQKSKKDYIVQIAMPVFLENGFKGTSIDMVVKRCGVSKPTVYNHFPDKAALMLAVMQQWIETRKPLIMPLNNTEALQSYIETRWLTAETVRFYALVIGEGWRFPQARALFWEQFDELWRKALGFLAEHSADANAKSLEPLLDHLLLQRLKQI